MPVLAIASNQVLIITTSDSSYQQQLSATIQQKLTDTDFKYEASDADSIDESSLINIEIVVAIGQDSVTVIRKNSFRAEILKALSGSANNGASSSAANESRIHMTQPLCRQFRLIKALNPNWKTVGLLLSAENQIRASTVSTCATKHNLQTRTVVVDDDSSLITALNTVLNNSDILLSLPDPDIYNSRTIKNILLTSYRHKIPVIGFSESFAHAGAIAAVHTSPQQLGVQVAQIVSNYYDENKTFSKPVYYPSDFTVTTNQQVARSLGFTLDNARSIESTLRNMEPGNE